MPDPAETVRTEEQAPEVAAEASPAAQPTEPDAAAVRVKELEAEVASWKDRALRTLAEMENLRRRTEREVADAKSFGVSSFARDMVAVADNLQRAQASLPAEARHDLAPPVKSFVEGIELTERDFLSRLARFGVKPIETVGARFDPNRHEALYEVPDPSVPHGTVAQTVETGYTIGDRVLRPAKVGVSRGGPKDATAG